MEVERIVEIERFFPSCIGNFQEFRRIAETENPEFRKLYAELDRLWKNPLILYADLQGIKRWEKLLSITPPPGASLEERKKNILIKWNNELPYTMQRLLERLETVLGGREYFSVTRDLAERELFVDVWEQGYWVLRQILETVKEMIPANMILLLTAHYQTSVEVIYEMAAALSMIAYFTRGYTCILDFLYLDGTWDLDGQWCLGGYQLESVPDFYPVSVVYLGQAKMEPSCQTEMSADVFVCIPVRWDVIQSVSVGIHSLLSVDGYPGCFMEARESMAVESALTVENNLWYLDGAIALDGTKKMDAAIFNYML